MAQGVSSLKPGEVAWLENLRFQIEEGGPPIPRDLCSPNPFTECLAPKLGNREMFAAPRLVGFGPQAAARACKNLGAEIYVPIRVEKGRTVPTVTEPQIACVLSGSAWIKEREIGGRPENRSEEIRSLSHGTRPYELQ